jgi:hypothetical protein
MIRLAARPPRGPAGAAAGSSDADGLGRWLRLLTSVSLGRAAISGPCAAFLLTWLATTARQSGARQRDLPERCGPAARPERIGGRRLPAAAAPGAERAAAGEGWVRPGHAAGERARTPSPARAPACPGVARAGRTLARRVGVAG